MHGMVMVFFFLIPSIPAVLGNFLMPIMIGAKDLAFPRINLLSWYLYIIGGLLMIYTILDRRRRHRLDFLHALQHRVHQYQCHRGRTRHLHRRLLLHSHRPEFHRHHPPHARSGHDLVPPAALRLVALCHQHHPGAGHAGHRHHHRAGGARTRSSTSASSIPRSEAIRFSSSICSGSIRIPPFTS